MSLTARIAYNTGIQVVGKIISVFLGVVTVGLLTRYLGQSGYGQYTTAVAFMQFFGILADLGLYIVAVKWISQAEHDSEKIFSNIFTLRLVSALIFVAAAPLVVLFFDYPFVVKMGVLLLTATNFFLSLNQLLIGLYQKSLAMGRAAVGEIVGKAVFLGLIVLALAFHGSLFSFFIAFTLGSAAQFFVSLSLARKYLHIKLRFDREIWIAVLKDSWPIALTIALNLIYFRADTIILSLYHSAATVGLYGASYKVLEVLIAFPAMFAGLVLPVLTKHHAENNHEGFQSAYQKSFDFLSLVALPMIAVIFLLAHPIMTLVAGSQFAEAGSILRVLIFATGSIFVGNLFGNTVVAIGAQRSMIPIYAVVAAGSLIAYLALIPHYGVWGAAGVTVATEVSITLGSFWTIWRKKKTGVRLGQFFRTLLATLLLSVVVYWTRQFGLFPALLAAAIAYPAFLFAVGGLKQELVKTIMTLR